MSHVVEGDVGCTLRCDTLEAIVGNHGIGRPVDFVKIDAEGAEAAIVRSTDWRRLRPRVLVTGAGLGPYGAGSVGGLHQGSNHTAVRIS